MSLLKEELLSRLAEHRMQGDWTCRVCLMAYPCDASLAYKRLAAADRLAEAVRNHRAVERGLLVYVTDDEFAGVRKTARALDEAEAAYRAADSREGET